MVIPGALQGNLSETLGTFQGISRNVAVKLRSFTRRGGGFMCIEYRQIKHFLE